MKAKSIIRRIENLEDRLNPRKPIPNMSEDELWEKWKTALDELLGFVPPYLLLPNLKGKEMPINSDSEEVRKEYELFVEEFLDCGRSVNPYSENLEIYEALWELEKEFAKKENRKANFGLNVLCANKEELEVFKTLRDSCKMPPISPEHRKAIKEVMAKIGNEKPNL